MQKRYVKRHMRTVLNNITREGYNTLARNLINIPGQSQFVVDVVLKQVEKECRLLTSRKFNSLIQHHTPSHLAEFKCKKVLDEWRTAAPTFLRFLKCASAADKATKHKAKGERYLKRRNCTRNIPEVTMAGLILLKARSKFMSSTMFRNSMILRHGGAKKRCIDRLNRIGVCVNHSSTLKMIKEIAETWDARILEWKKTMCDSPSLEDLSWMDEPGCSSSFLSDHTYHREEKKVEEVLIDTSSESEEVCKICFKNICIVY